MITFFKEILSGQRIISDILRYEFARIGVAAVHIMLLILSFYIGCYPIAIFNCFSVFFYVVIIEILIRRERYMTAFVSTYLEIILHSFFACIIMGWAFGFSLYNIGLIYVAYYFSYTSHMLHKKILIPSILGIINLMLTFVMRLWSFTREPLFTDYPASFALSVSSLNIFIVAIMIMIFATFHTAEIRRREHELHVAIANLDKLAHFDALTKLRNRHSMEEELHAILGKTDDPYCFIMGDIDDFKSFNDNYGHSCGDYVLTEVANIIMKNMGDKHIACRWGGEEILMLIRGTLEYSHIIAEKIRFEIENMDNVYKGIPIHITMTFGAALYTPNDSFEKCISKADKRLYYGKQNGKNCVISE